MPNPRSRKALIALGLLSALLLVACDNNNESDMEESAEETYEETKESVKEGYEESKEAVKEGYEESKEKAGEAWEESKEAIDGGN